MYETSKDNIEMIEEQLKLQAKKTENAYAEYIESMAKSIE